jgi:hypothetical protein
MIFGSEFSPTSLWQGCVLATIAHAIFSTQHPELANEQSWDGGNYNLQDTQGTLGTVTFAKEGVVGAFFDSHSPRSPFSSSAVYRLNDRLEDMPSDLRDLSDRETLQYLIQDLNGIDTSVITAAFWGHGGQLVAAEPWPDVFSNGAHLIGTQLQPAEEAIALWQSHYGLSTGQVGFMRSLYVRKLAAGELKIVLTEQDKNELTRQGSQGLEQGRDLLAGIAMIIP